MTFARRGPFAVRMGMALAVFGAGCHGSDGKRSIDTANGCLETKSELDADSPTPLGYSVKEVLPLTSTQRTAAIAWNDGTHSTLTMSFADERGYWVQSHDDPNATLAIARSCFDHVAIVAQIRIATDDGRLSETFFPVELAVVDRDHVQGSVAGAPAAEIRGTYGANVEQGSCLLYIQINFGLSSAAFSGSIVETRADAPCERVGAQAGVSSVMGGQWGQSDVD